ncbi:hypothetical protein FHX37_2827 [Haloactinospora alba]|uniref:Uncharacterized protein n=1 Tax=Haloactinospora alba TaxID=405555 RepID=A0A543NM03_9ACTN|nr:hypothetical protein [Haloactinospora alba]TQN32842.1 hypothetical protein FHX37_2827 [Haloactinospora alba]
MSERENPPKSKQGVSGWRAFLMMFGCGTMAAFLVVGVAAGAVKMVFGFSENHEQESEGDGEIPSNATGSPQSSLDSGELDLCSTTIRSISKINVNRLDSDDSYKDEERGGGRTVSDDCKWELYPDYESLNPWNFKLSYNAIINSDRENSPEEIAKNDFRKKKKEVEPSFSSVEDKGKSKMSDNSFFFYGKKEDNVTYLSLVQTRGVVYKIEMSSNANGHDDSLVPKEAFENEIKKIVRRVDLDLNLWIPSS